MMEVLAFITYKSCNTLNDLLEMPYIRVISLYNYLYHFEMLNNQDYVDEYRKQARLRQTKPDLETFRKYIK